MFVRVVSSPFIFSGSLLAFLVICGVASVQAEPQYDPLAPTNATDKQGDESPKQGDESPNWRSPAPQASRIDTQDQPSQAEAEVKPASARGRSGTIGRLPNSHGQIWREYNIAPYTSTVQASNRHPQQAIVDWILRDTGYAAWHSDVVAVLSASPKVLKVYHTPDMQRTVGEIVDRYVSAASNTYMYGLNIYTVGHPDWRTRAQRMLQAVPVQSDGVEAWLVAREDAMLLRENLARRSDFQKHSSSRLLAKNGQNTVIDFKRQHPYVRSRLAPESNPTVENSNVGQVNEGVTIQLNPLMSGDGTTIDAMVKCEIDQLERLVQVRLQSPPAVNQGRPWYKIDVPQRVSFEFHERFRWPRNKVLVVSLGMVPRPLPHFSITESVKLPVPKTPPRGDLVIFIEHKGDAVDADTADGSGPRKTQNFRGRY